MHFIVLLLRFCAPCFLVPLVSVWLVCVVSSLLLGPFFGTALTCFLVLLRFAVAVSVFAFLSLLLLGVLLCFW